jgi:hypothetical protein
MFNGLKSKQVTLKRGPPQLPIGICFTTFFRNGYGERASFPPDADPGEYLFVAFKHNNESLRPCPWRQATHPSEVGRATFPFLFAIASPLVTNHDEILEEVLKYFNEYLNALNYESPRHFGGCVSLEIFAGGKCKWDGTVLRLNLSAPSLELDSSLIEPFKSILCSLFRDKVQIVDDDSVFCDLTNEFLVERNEMLRVHETARSALSNDVASLTEQVRVERLRRAELEKERRLREDAAIAKLKTGLSEQKKMFEVERKLFADKIGVFQIRYEERLKLQREQEDARRMHELEQVQEKLRQDRLLELRSNNVKLFTMADAVRRHIQQLTQDIFLAPVSIRAAAQKEIDSLNEEFSGIMSLVVISDDRSWVEAFCQENPAFEWLYEELQLNSAWIYCMSNSSHPGVFKVGFTRRNDPGDRAKELSKTQPSAYVIELVAKTNNPIQDERALHTVLSEFRTTGEYFRCPLELVRNAFVQNGLVVQAYPFIDLRSAATNSDGPVQTRNWLCHSAEQPVWNPAEMKFLSTSPHDSGDGYKSLIVLKKAIMSKKTVQGLLHISSVNTLVPVRKLSPEHIWENAVEHGARPQVRTRSDETKSEDNDDDGLFNPFSQ